MDSFSHLRCSRITRTLPLLLIFAASQAAAVSVTYNTRSVCKVHSVFYDEDSGPGVMNAFCMVDIRPNNMKEIMLARLAGDDSGVTGMPLFRASASARLALMPNASDASNGNANGSPSEMEAFLNAPFNSLTEAMRAFTGQQDLDLGLGGLPFAGLPDLSDASPGLSAIYTVLSQQGAVNGNVSGVEPQAMPIPPAGYLLGAGLVGLVGLAARRRRPAG